MDLKRAVEDALAATRYHPDYADEMQRVFQEALAQYRAAPSPGNEARARSFAYDATLMREKFFRGRLEFLTRLIGILGERPEERLAVAEDGCGSGTDLHVVGSMLKEKVALTGIDKNAVSLGRARERAPGVRLLSDFDGSTFHCVYSDFVSIDESIVWQVGERGDRTFDALRSPGLALHNADMGRLDLHLRFFGRKFARILPTELLAEVEDGPDCRLCRFEKD